MIYVAQPLLRGNVVFVSSWLSFIPPLLMAVILDDSLANSKSPLWFTAYSRTQACECSLSMLPWYGPVNCRGGVSVYELTGSLAGYGFITGVGGGRGLGGFNHLQQFRQNRRQVLAWRTVSVNQLLDSLQQNGGKRDMHNCMHVRTHTHTQTKTCTHMHKLNLTAHIHKHICVQLHCCSLFQSIFLQM